LQSPGIEEISCRPKVGAVDFILDVVTGLAIEDIKKIGLELNVISIPELEVLGVVQIDLIVIAGGPGPRGFSEATGIARAAGEGTINLDIPWPD